MKVALGPTPMKLFELMSECMCIRRARSKNSRGSDRLRSVGEGLNSYTHIVEIGPLFR